MMLSDRQRQLCERLGVVPLETLADQKVGVSQGVLDGAEPLHGLRHKPTVGTAGWFLWTGGEPSSDPEFFRPMHASHLAEVRPEVLQYLALPPGWRFLVAAGYEDVWFDAQLLDVAGD